MISSDVIRGYGMEALSCINSAQIDLAILDVMLPDLDGFHLCQKIRITTTEVLRLT